MTYRSLNALHFTHYIYINKSDNLISVIDYVPEDD